MTAPTVYKWDDTNAPVLSGTVSSLKALLKACLVDGYGTKAAAGWSMPFEDTNLAAFRNSVTTGKGVCLRLDDSDTTASIFTAFESMSDVNTGVGPFIPSSGTFTIYKSNVASTASRVWMLIANDKFFYLIIRRYETGSPAAYPYETDFFFFGDFIKTTGEGFNSVIGYSVANTVVSGYGTQDTPGGAGNTGISSSRPKSGVANTPTKLWETWSGPARMYSSYSGAWVQQGQTYDGSQIILIKPVIGDAGGYNMRGFLPGLYVPCHNYDQFTQFQTINDQVSGKTLMNLRIDGVYYGSGTYYGNGVNGFQCLRMIDLGDWDA